MLVLIGYGREVSTAGAMVYVDFNWAIKDVDYIAHTVSGFSMSVTWYPWCSPDEFFQVHGCLDQRLAYRKRAASTIDLAEHHTSVLAFAYFGIKMWNAYYVKNFVRAMYANFSDNCLSSRLRWAFIVQAGFVLTLWNIVNQSARFRVTYC